MATGTERQRAYRNRQSEGSDQRLNTWISAAASQALARLSDHYGLSRRAILERLLLNAEKAPDQSIGAHAPDLQETRHGSDLQPHRTEKNHG